MMIKGQGGPVEFVRGMQFIHAASALGDAISIDLIKKLHSCV